jgi:hypothetical protein
MARRESCNDSMSDGITLPNDDATDTDDDVVDADEREAVDGEEQHNADVAGAIVSVEQPGPPVGLYLRDNIAALTSFIPIALKRVGSLTRHYIPPCSQE